MEVQYKPIIFTKEEMKVIKYHLPTIESIIVNHSYSNLTVAFRQDMKKLGDKIGLNFCTTCSSGIFNLVSRIYKKYNEQLINEKYNEQLINERKQKNGRKKRNSGAQG